MYSMFAVLFSSLCLMGSVYGGGIRFPDQPGKCSVGHMWNDVTKCLNCEIDSLIDRCVADENMMKSFGICYKKIIMKNWDDLFGKCLAGTEQSCIKVSSDVLNIFRSQYDQQAASLLASGACLYGKTPELVDRCFSVCDEQPHMDSHVEFPLIECYKRDQTAFDILMRDFVTCIKSSPVA